MGGRVWWCHGQNGGRVWVERPRRTSSEGGGVWCRPPPTMPPPRAALSGPSPLSWALPSEGESSYRGKRVKFSLRGEGRVFLHQNGAKLSPSWAEGIAEGDKSAPNRERAFGLLDQQPGAAQIAGNYAASTHKAARPFLESAPCESRLRLATPPAPCAHRLFR